jgi:hypothetical protein
VHKAQTLLQAAAGGLRVDDWSAKHEQADMVECANRVLGAVSVHACAAACAPVSPGDARF